MFTNFRSYHKLKELAKTPIDLTQKNVLSSERIREYTVKTDEWVMSYGTERINRPVLSALQDLIQESGAQEKMHSMQCGEKINSIETNPSSGSEVSHTFMRLPIRDDTVSSSRSEKEKDFVKNLQKEHQKLLFLEKEMSREKITDLVVIGIGGSELGPHAIYLAIKKYSLPDRKVHFIANIDSDNLFDVLSSLNISQTAILVISKSGSTLETRINEILARKYCKERGIESRKLFFAVTEKHSPMDNPEQYREIFYLPKGVGGRYSSTSMVGGVILTFALGYTHYAHFLEGAHAMDQIAMQKEMMKNLPLLGAALTIWNRNFLSIPHLAIIPYAQPLERFTAHLQQCDMESNGKQTLRGNVPTPFSTGPLIWGEVGTNAQHSFFQWIHQGTDISSLEFIGFSHSQRLELEEETVVEETTSQEKLLSNLFAQSIALAKGKKSESSHEHFPGNHPHHILLGKQLTPYSMGSLLAYYEHKIAFQGFIWGINPFDQPGVQLGKILSNEFMDLFRMRRKGKDFAQESSLHSALLSLSSLV